MRQPANSSGTLASGMTGRGTDDAGLEAYEGLVFKTAQMYVGVVEEDFDDLRQILRIKVWKARASYDSGRSKQTEEAYVFSCVKNQCKDLVKAANRRAAARSEATQRGRGVPAKQTDERGDARSVDPEMRRDVYIESFASSGPGEQSPLDRFEGRYLRADDVFAEIEDDEVLVPSTLSHVAVEVLAALYVGYSQVEVAVRLGISKRQVEGAVKELREKMADWNPSPSSDTVPDALVTAA